MAGVPVGQGLKQRGGGAGPKRGGVRTGRAPGGGRALVMPVCRWVQRGGMLLQ